MHPPKDSFEESALKVESLDFWEGVAIVVGAGIGAGVLSLAYGAKNAGWPVLVFWLVVTGVLTAISMLYVAETTLRTRKPLQLSGLAEKYVGRVGAWFMFLAVFVNALGALTAYTTGSGEIISEFFGIPPLVGSLLFFVPAILVIWYGLKALGVAEKYISAGMVLLLLILVLATIIGPGIEVKHLTFTNVTLAIPVFGLVVFNYIGQYTVPELARGFVRGNPRQLPRVIIWGMVITGCLMILIPGAALGLTGPEDISEVLTIAWGEALGQWAFFTANGFALLAMLTSFWAIGESFLTNIVDHFKFPSEWDKKYRLLALASVGIPPLIIAYSGLVGFVDLLYIAGSFSGPIMAIIPVLMVNRSRKIGDRKPEWTCGRLAHPLIQGILILMFVGAPVYTVLDVFGFLPSGW